MHREYLALLRFGAAALDAVALAALWWGTLQLRLWLGEAWTYDLVPGPEPLLRPLGIAAHTPLVALVVPVWLAVLYGRGHYTALRRAGLGLGRVVGSSALAALALFTTLYLLQADYVSRTVLVGFAALSVPALALSRSAQLAALRSLRRGRFDPHRVLLVGRSADARPWLDAVASHPEWGVTVLGRVGTGDDPLPALGDVADLPRLLHAAHVDELYVAGHDPGALSGLAALCEELGVRLTLDANFLGLRTARAEVADLDGWRVLSFTTVPSRGVELAIKRGLDVVLAMIGLVLAAPVVAIAALLVRRDGGPALYVQERAGLHGRPFRMLKLRTMVVGADAIVPPGNEVVGPAFKLRDNPRVTAVGRWLRRTSIDELPQLVNVLRGEMSLVGPRPPLLSEVARYDRWQLRRLSMRPGLTCIWQVSGRSDVADFDRWTRLDLQYIDTWSLWLDLRLLLRTVPVVLSGTGAR